MSDWDAIFGEAALGLDLAKADLVRAGSGQAPDQRSPAQAQPGPHRPRPAGQAAASSASPPAGPGARRGQAAGPSLKLVRRPLAPAVNPEAIFRPEALEFRARGRDAPGGVVRLGARWIHWAYRMMIILVAAGVAAMWVIRTDEGASGPAVIDGRTGAVAALLPAVTGPDLARSRGLTVTLPSGKSARVTGLHAQLASASSIRRAGLVPPAQPAILVTGQLTPGAASDGQGARLRAEASVVLRSEPLAAVLARQFGAMLGNGTAP